MLSSQYQFVKSKGEEVLLVTATAMDFWCTPPVAGTRSVCVSEGSPSWGWKAQLSQREGFITPPTCVTEKAVLAPTQLLKRSHLSPSCFSSRQRGATTSGHNRRWGWGGTSVEAKSHTWDMWVEKDPVLGRHLEFSQACLCLTFSNNLSLTSITVGAIKAGGQGPWESITLPIGVFRLCHMKGRDQC